MEGGHDVGEIFTQMLMAFCHIQWFASMFLWWTAASPCECGLTYNMYLQDRHCYSLEQAFKSLGTFWCPHSPNSRSSSLVSLRTVWLVRRANADRPTIRPESEEKRLAERGTRKAHTAGQTRFMFNAHARRW